MSEDYKTRQPEGNIAIYIMWAGWGRVIDRGKQEGAGCENWLV